MPCGLCHNKERGAEEAKDYLCSRCTIRLVGLNKRQKREFVDALYMQGKDEEAEFVESFFPSGIDKPVNDKIVTKPNLLLRRTVNI